MCALVLEQQKSGRQVIRYGLDSECELRCSITYRHEGPVDELHPLYPLLALVDRVLGRGVVRRPASWASAARLKRDEADEENRELLDEQ